MIIYETIVVALLSDWNSRIQTYASIQRVNCCFLRGCDWSIWWWHMLHFAIASHIHILYPFSMTYHVYMVYSYNILDSAACIVVHIICVGTHVLVAAITFDGERKSILHIKYIKYCQISLIPLMLPNECKPIRIRIYIFRHVSSSTFHGAIRIMSCYLSISFESIPLLLTYLEFLSRMIFWQKNSTRTAPYIVQTHSSVGSQSQALL